MFLSTLDHTNTINPLEKSLNKMSQFETLIKKAYDVKVEKVGTKKVSLNIRWLDVQGKMQTDNVRIEVVIDSCFLIEMQK